MNVFSSAPFIRILPAFLCGIILSFYKIGDKSFIVGLLFFDVLIFLLWIKTQYKKQYKFRFVNPGLLIIAFFCCGWLLNTIKSELVSKQNDFNPKTKFVMARIIAIPSVVGQMQRTEVEVSGFTDSIQWHTSNFKAYLYYVDSLYPNLNVGDVILIHNRFKEIEAPLNPGQFDFKKYAALKRISYQCRISDGSIRILEVNKRFSVLRSAKKIRDKLLESFHRAGITGQEYAVLSALVLGYDDEINKEIMSAFSASGTLHILSVSGMHVGIVFSALSLLFRKLENKEGWKLIRVFAMILLIWMYAILTGLSPSVIRSAMMFTFILVGKSLNRNSNIYNTLAASAIIIWLVFDPLLIFEAGFQLSYLAVAGIAFIYPKIFNWFYIKNKIASAVWSLVAVSIAAQLATCPISLYYFHQFPNYFILANLAIIPVSTIAIFGGLFLLAISPFDFLIMKVGYIMNQIMHFLNFLAATIKALPFSVTEDLYLNLSEMIILDAVILSIIFFFLEKSVQKLKMTVFFLIVFISLKSISTFENQRRNAICIYATKSKGIFEIFNGEKSYLYFHSQDSLKAQKVSDDLHASYHISRNERIQFDLDDTLNLFFKKYIVVKNTILQIDTVSKVKEFNEFQIK